MKAPPCTHRTTCRLCGSTHVELAVPIAPTPVADAYVPNTPRAEAQSLFPLDLYLCTSCGHAQLLDVVNPDVLFSDYIYSTSISLGLVEHFRRYARDVVTQFAVPAGALAVDIGSNDGTLLRFLKDQELRVLGVDPARRIAKQATESGIPTLPVFFNRDTARQIVLDQGFATLVTANNVFAHADDLSEIARGIGEMLSPDGVFIFEVSYIGDIIERYLFDTVYHEHLCYHALAPLVSFFQRHGLEFFDVQRITNKGGSIRGFVQRAGGPRTVTERFTAMLAEEKTQRWTELPRFRRFADDLARIKHELTEILRELKISGSVIAGFGASATVTTLLHNFELGRWLEFLVDDNTARHGLCSPGYHLPVLSPAALREHNVDIVLIAAWQYAEPIMKKHADFLESGGRFLVPLPRPRLVGNAGASIVAAR